MKVEEEMLTENFLGEGSTFELDLMTIFKSEDWRATLIWKLETDMGTDLCWKSASSVLWAGLNPTICIWEWSSRSLASKYVAFLPFFIGLTDPTIPWTFALSASVAEAKLSKSSVRLRFCPIAMSR